MTRLLLALTLLALAGCHALQGSTEWNSPCVRINSTHGTGHGVAISSSRVATALHVVDSGGLQVTGTDGRKYPAWEVARLPSTIEPIVILATRAPLPPSLTMRQARPGDSGSPVVVDDEVVGIVYGWSQVTGTVLCLPVFEAQEILRRFGNGR